MKRMSSIILCLLVVVGVGLNSCGKKESAFVGSWEATTVKLGETTVKASDIGGMSLVLKEDMSFEHKEDKQTDAGTWKLSEDGKSLELNYTALSRKNTLAISEQKDNAWTATYEEYGMKRSINFEKK